MMQVVVATRNEKKRREIESILAGLDVQVVDLSSFPDAPKVAEDGSTFAENAAKKARVIARYTGYLTIADDSGLCVDALDGAPGIYSARFAGPGANDRKNNAKLLKLLSGIPSRRRTARFVCSIAVANRRGVVGSAQGVHRGRIVDAPRGSNGFGYDPLFYSPRWRKTFAQLPPAVKNKVSHRARALVKARKIIAAAYRKRK